MTNKELGRLLENIQKLIFEATEGNGTTKAKLLQHLKHLTHEVSHLEQE